MILILFLLSETYTGNFEFEISELQFIQCENTTKLRLSGWEITDEVGAPELPSKTINIALPLGARIEKIEIISTTQREFELYSGLSFVRKPVILSQENIVRNEEPDKSIYLSSNPYPEDILQIKGSGILGNYQVCEILCIPFHYYPLSKKLVVYNSIKFAIHYQGGERYQTKNDLIKKIASNSDDIFTIPQRTERGQLQYVIITESPMDTVFQRLADWKTKKGIPACVRNVNWIINHYPGEDSAARIRNYLKTIQDSGGVYVLLGGDIDYIPCRFAYAMTCSANIYPGREDTMPCDLYYADLQGTWDIDNDRSYGEVEDSIDLYPDLIIGRAPVNTIAEAQKFVEKILIYEKNPPAEYLDNGLFTAEILWQEPYTDQGVHKNMIGNTSFPNYFQITKLYQSLGNETKEAVMAAIRQGQNLINHDGHGWINLISVGGWPHRIYNADFDTITNAPGYGILYSIGCWTNAFDSASVSEAFVNSPNGGGVAYIGNSSYGWGSPGNPGFGYSDRFDFRFFYSLLKEDNHHLGEALAMAKAYFIPYSREKNVYRWHQYQLNLIGDPELPVWTRIPDTMIAFTPGYLPLGNTRILITVKDKKTNTPLRNALVCLMKDNESYSSGYTDASGSIFLNTNAYTAGSFDLTITCHNYLLIESVIPVIDGGYVNYGGWLINDIFGNNDHIPNPGEDILLPTKIINCGDTVARNIHLVVSTNDTFAIVLDSVAFVDSLLPDDSIMIDNAFGIKIKNNAKNGTCIEFNLRVIFNNQNLIFKPNILVGSPEIKMERTDITTLPALPGQIESLYINLKNSGYGAGHLVRAGLSSINPYTFVLIDTVRFGEIPPETLKYAPEPFVVYISPFCPLPYISKFLLNVHSENYLFTDTISVLIGETGFSDDMESGANLWTTGGLNNLWHISNRKYFSQSHSWYCGNDTSGQYVNNMNCYIQTIPFMIQKNSLLKFHRWFQVPIYGSDGIYIIVMHNSQADTLDFIGTGGALKQRPIQSDWFCEKYLLSDYSAGDSIQIRIAFVSDNDGKTGEGFYIDDVVVEYNTDIEEFNMASRLQNLRLETQPNPFKNRLIIKFQIPNHKSHTTKENSGQDFSLKIYDATGRLVYNFSQLKINDGWSMTAWSGEDNSGRRLAAGIYFVQLEVEGYKKIEKVIILR
uniref:T9SS type A sorting domain-containing protein n=1 Tax=candidate division WOR-3 bacterium TaxID=2052148 RepID=A0A7V1EI97_UNCW3